MSRPARDAGAYVAAGGGETEAGFRAWVTDCAAIHGWVWSYFPQSQMVQGEPGVPDLLLVRPPRLLYVELKTTRGRLRPEQRYWLNLLADTRAETAIWRPADRPLIEATLR